MYVHILNIYKCVIMCKYLEHIQNDASVVGTQVAESVKGFQNYNIPPALKRHRACPVEPKGRNMKMEEIEETGDAWRGWCMKKSFAKECNQFRVSMCI